MKQMWHRAFALTVVLALVACAGSIEVVTPVSDLVAVVKHPEKVRMATVRMFVENLEKVEDVNFLRENLNSFSNETLEKGKGSDGMAFDILVPLVSDKDLGETDDSKNLLRVVVHADDQDLSFRYEFNDTLVQKIQDYVQGKYNSTLDLNNFAVQFTVSNDLADPVVLVANSVYAQGKPYPYSFMQTLKTGEQVNLNISEVLRRAILEKSVVSEVIHIKMGT